MKTSKKTAAKLPTSGYAQTMMTMALNSPGERVHVAWPNEKRAVRQLEEAGLVTVERPGTRCADFEEWFYKATPAALKAAR